ncbi:MAG TPA: type II secretion system protein N [Cellvibrio sp.]|nr:type II secretion system protein N [Cellvibrio sp.]
MKTPVLSALPLSSFVWIFSVTKKFWIILGVVFWLYFVISHIPAVWGAYLMTRDGNLGMTGVSGTLWSGRASLASVKVKGADYSLGQMTWELSPFSLLLLKPCAKIETQMDSQQMNGRVCVGLNGSMDVSKATISLPTRLMQMQLPLPVDGKFNLYLDSLAMKNNQVSNLQGKLGWSEAKVFNGVGWMDIGGFGADLADDGNAGVSVHVFDVNSPVHVDITALFLSPTGVSLKGKLSMSEAFAQQANATALLSMLATPTAPDEQGNLQYIVDMTF